MTRAQAAAILPSHTIAIEVGAMLTVPAQTPVDLRVALCKPFVIANPKYREAKEHERSTRGLATHLQYYDKDNDGSVTLPRGARALVGRICRAHGYVPEGVDRTHLAPAVAFAERITLSAAQERAVGDLLAVREGVLEAPAGAGKTVMGMVAIARRAQPALWIVHTKELANQAIGSAGKVLGLSPDEIGFIGEGRAASESV
jgi:hypothetical protein